MAFFTTEPEGSPGDLAGVTGGNLADETEEAVAVTDPGSSVDPVHAPDEARDDGSEDPNEKTSSLSWDVPKYDDTDADCADPEEKDEGENRVEGNATGKKVKESHGVPFDRERANRNSLLLLLSLLLVAAMLAVVWCSFSQPLILVWRLSLLVCSCCTIWARLLAITLRAQTALHRLVFVFVLALYVDSALDPKIGMLIVHLNTHIAVGVLGYALAERRQDEGAEVSATTVPVPLDKKHADRLFCAQLLGGAYFGVITLAVAAGVAWVVCHAADFSTEVLVVYVFLPLCCALVPWIAFVGSMLLRGALIGEMEFGALVLYLTMATLIYAWSVLALGQVWAMLIAWPLMLGFPGVFGYCICVHSTYKLRMKLGLPPVKLNESKEDSSLRMLLEKHCQGSEHPQPRNNNAIISSFSTHGEAGLKSKIA